VIRTQILCKLLESSLVSVILFLDFEAKAMGQILVMFKNTAYVIEVLIKLNRPLREVSIRTRPG
jgi:hypothetical protein